VSTNSIVCCSWHEIKAEEIGELKAEDADEVGDCSARIGRNDIKICLKFFRPEVTEGRLRVSTAAERERVER
jgi:hypothetical protein